MKKMKNIVIIKTIKKAFMVFVLGHIILLLSACQHQTTPFSPNPLKQTMKIDDFEDKNLMAAGGNIWSNAISFGDKISSEIVLPGCNWSSAAIRFDYVLFNWANLHINLGVQDLSQSAGLHFAVRGNGKLMRVDIATTNVKDTDYYSYKIGSTSEDWTEHYIYFNDLRRNGFGAQSPVPVFDPSMINRIQFTADSGVFDEVGWFEIDDVYFFGK